MDLLLTIILILKLEKIQDKRKKRNMSCSGFKPGTTTCNCCFTICQRDLKNVGHKNGGISRLRSHSEAQDYSMDSCPQRSTLLETIEKPAGSHRIILSSNLCSAQLLDKMILCGSLCSCPPNFCPPDSCPPDFGPPWLLPAGLLPTG